MPDQPMQLVLGSPNYSSWSLRPWFAMVGLGLAFDEIVIDIMRPGRREAILPHSPTGKVPALKVGGTVISDSLAILEFLAEEHRSLWPADRKARAHARMLSAEMHSGFQPLRQHCPMDFLARTPMAELPEPVAADVSRIVAAWRGARQAFGAGGPFLFGTETAADAMFAPIVSRFLTYVPDLTPYGDDGTAAAYVAAMAATPRFGRWAEKSRPAA